jgi:ribosome-binding protein aMBF1 (putative translation factor)
MTSHHSSIGARVEDEIARKRTRNARYRDAHDRLRPFEEVARVVIMRRAQLGLSQQEVADRVGTTASVISRIESGQHRTSIETLRRLAEALGGHALLGFDFGTASKPDRELIRL